MATDWIMRDIGTEMVLTGTVRHDVPRLPRRPVRETVANAAAHRDYANDRAPVVVEIRPSSVTVKSPGALPPPVTVATLREAQSARNHTVIDVLRRFGLAEDSGHGIDVIQDGMRYELLDEPVFRERDDAFEVTLSLKGLITATERGWLAELERTGTLKPAERQLLVTALREERISNRRVRDILGVGRGSGGLRRWRFCAASWPRASSSRAGRIEGRGTRPCLRLLLLRRQREPAHELFLQEHEHQQGRY